MLASPPRFQVGGGGALSPARAYVAPSLAVAHAERLKKHPSEEDPSGHSRRLFRCCTPAGRFCFNSCAWFDPCCEGKESSFVLYGAGTTSYFKGIKLLAWVAVLMTICYVPNLLINVNGRGTLVSLSSLTLAATTLGNNGLLGTGYVNASAGGNVTGAVVTVPGWSLLVGHSGMQPTTAVLIYALCDLAACVFFLCGFLWVKAAEGIEERQVNKLTITADDYSVYLPWVPPDTTEADVRAYFAHITAAPTREAWDAKRYTGLFDVAEVQIIEDNASTVGTFKRRGAVLMEIERIVLRMRYVSLRMSMRNDARCCAASYPRQMKRLEARKAALDAEADAMGNHAVLRASSAAVGAFVTFDRAEARDWVLDQYDASLASWLCLSRFFYLKGHRVQVLPAQPPTAVIWENLHVTNCERAARIAVTTLLTLVTLVGSFVALWFASWQAAQFQEGQNVANCGALAAPSTYCPPPANLTSLLALPVKSPALYCTCACLPWASATYDTLTRVPSAAAVATTGVLPASACPFQACPRWFTFDVQGVWAQPFCVEWATNRGIVLGLTVAASAVVLLINVFLGVVMRALTRFEGHRFVDDLNSSLALRMFVACFANTALLVVLINVAWPNMPENGTGFLTPGKYADFTAGWYATVGVSLITTMLINVVAPHVYPVCAGLHYCRRVSSEGLTAPSQRDLNQKLLGPYNDVSMRYAQLYNTLFVCFSFSTGIPVMLPIMALSMVLFYWVDKAAFMWFYRAPKTSGVRMQGIMTALLPVALVMHLGIGVWQLSAVPSIAAVANGVAAYKSLVAFSAPLVNRATLLAESLNNSVLLLGVKRVTDTGVLPLFIMFLGVAACLALWGVYALLSGVLKTCVRVVTCNCACCPNCVQKKSNPWYFDIPSFTWATDPARNKNDPRWAQYRLQGVPSYNILMNPEIMQAFAIPKAFARAHHHLTDVALFRGESLKPGSSRAASPPAQMLRGALSIRQLPASLGGPPTPTQQEVLQAGPPRAAAQAQPQEDYGECEDAEDEEEEGEGYADEDADLSPSYKASVRRFVVEPAKSPAGSPRGTSV